MCESCSETAVQITEDNFFEQMKERKEELLDSEVLEAHFNDAFDELLVSYSMFRRNAFQLDQNEEELAKQNEQWKAQFEGLMEKIEAFRRGDINMEEEPEEEPPLAAPEWPGRNLFRVTR